MKAYRERACWAMVKDIRNHPGPPLWTKARSTCVFYFKDKRWHDPDGLLSMLKSAFDGIVDSGLLADDRDLSHDPVERLVDKANPRVTITITERR